MDMTKVQIADGYDMRIGDLEKFIDISKQQGFTEALYAAYMTGWQRHENMIRSNNKKARKTA